MKNLISFIVIAIIIAGTLYPKKSIAQVPEKMSYQAVVRDGNNQLLINQVVGVRISILQGSVNGTTVFEEDHETETNNNGLVTLEIGNGIVNSGYFDTLNWSNGPYYIKTGTDPTGGINYSIVGTSQLLSVPYALHAKTVENDQVNDADADSTNEIQSINLIDGWKITLSKGGGTIYLPFDTVFWSHIVDMPEGFRDGIDNVGISSETDPTIPSHIKQITSNDIDNWNDDKVNDADTDITNELQTISLSGSSQLTLSNGGGTINLPTGGGSILWSLNGNHVYYNSGNVGIDEMNPVSKLSVGGSGLENVLIFGDTNEGGGTAISGVDSYNDNDVLGVGVRGISEYGKGVYGSSSFGVGVVGESEDGIGIEATGGTIGVESFGVEYGIKGHGNVGVYGENEVDGAGVEGYSPAGIGVKATGGTNGIEATGEEYGVKAIGGYTGVYGKTENNDGAGVDGESDWGFGVRGTSKYSTGVIGSSDEDYGGYFSTSAPVGSNRSGLLGFSSNGTGIKASGGTIGLDANGDEIGVKGVGITMGGQFETVSGTGISGFSQMGTGIIGSSIDAVGIFASSMNDIGIKANGATVGGQFETSSGTAIKGISQSGNGGYFEVQNGDYTSAVYARNFTTSGEAYGGDFECRAPDGIAVRGLIESSSDGNSYGGYFETNSSSGTGVYASGGGTGIYGTTNNGEGAGVFGENTYNDDVPIAPGVKGVSSMGAGVMGSGGAYDFYAYGPGTDYGSSSSRRWKNNIKTIQTPLAMISKMRGVYFDWNKDHGGHHDIGFIAEEVGEVIPEIVDYEKNGIDAISVDYSKVTPLLVEAIKALMLENEQLKAENQDILTRLDKIEALLEVNAKK